MVSTDTERGKVEMGELDIQGGFTIDSDGVYYEPGESADLEDGTVKNTGTLPFIAKISLEGATTLVRDADGVRYTDPDDYRIVRNDPNVTVSFDADTIATKHENGKLVVWYRHNTTGDYYVVLDAGVEYAGIEASAEFSGEIGNEYMNAQVEFATGWQATQYTEEAIEAVWDLSLEDDLTLIPIDLGLGRFAEDPNVALKAELNRMLGRDLY